MAGGNVPAQLASIFQAAGHAYNIPPAVLAGISSVESNLFRNNGPSSAGAIGGMQFEPATARALGVNPNDPRSAIFGAAKLLVQYGYHQNPSRAIGAYNGGPGNPQMGYAQQVLSEAARLKGELSGNPGALPQSAGSSSTLGPTPSTQTGFDQAGYQRAVAASIAGNYLKGQGKSPFSIGPKTGLDSGSGVLMGPRLLTTKAPDPAMYKTAQNSLQQIAGGSQLAVHPGAVSQFKGYVNPLPGFTLGRTDMGVDANARPGTPIVALGDSKVVAIRPNWYSGQPYVQMQILNGPKAGQYWYVAEQIAPSVKAGQVVHAGEQIGRYAASGTGIEIGWGSPGWQTLAQAQGNTGGPGHSNSPAGQDFRNFLASL